MTVPHNDVVRREFGRQAPGFAAKASFFGLREIADWVSANLPLAPEGSVLDVCGGAGHLARALASRARRLVVLDLSTDLLETGRAAVEREGLDNVHFVEGDAAAIPFADGSFHTAVSRFAFHHLLDQAVVVAEMARVVEVGGHVAVIDMVSGGRRHDDLERLRDPSHTKAFTEQELLDMLTAAGLTVETRSVRRQAMPVGPWLKQASPPAEAAAEIERALMAEADGDGEPTGLMASRDPAGALHIAQDWVLVVARR